MLMPAALGYADKESGMGTTLPAGVGPAFDGVGTGCLAGSGREDMSGVGIDATFGVAYDTARGVGRVKNAATFVGSPNSSTSSPGRGTGGLCKESWSSPVVEPS